MERTINKSIEGLVADAIDRVIEGYPTQTYGKALVNPGFRKALMNHVLSQLSSQYFEIEKGQKFSNNPDGSPLSQEQQVFLKNLIRQEIVYIMQQKSECIKRSSPEDVDSCFAPSHWFG